MKELLFFIKRKIVLMILCPLLIAPFSIAWAETIPGFNQISTTPYTVDDLPISIDSDNAVHAREQAFERALQTGFTIILERLYPDSQARETIKTPSTQELGRMLQDFTTRDEQVGPKQYAATFQLRFRPGRVQKYLQSAGTADKPRIATDHTIKSPITPNTGESANNPHLPVSSLNPAHTATIPYKVLLLPYFQTAQGQILWAGQNPLRDALITHIQTHSTLAVVPLGDMDDRQILNEAYGIRVNPKSLQMLMAKYQTNRALMIVAVPDTMDLNTNATKMTLMFYGSSNVNPTPNYLDSVVASITDITNSADSSILFTRAADNIQSQIPILSSRINMDVPEQDILEAEPAAGTTLVVSSPSSEFTAPAPSTIPETSINIPKTGDSINSVLANTISPPTFPSTDNSDIQNSSPPLLTTESGIPMIVRFNTMTEWNDIRTRIKSIPGVSTIRITKLKAQEATIHIVTAQRDTNPTTFKAALNARGLELHVDSGTMNDPDSGNSTPFILTRGTVSGTNFAPTPQESSYNFNTSSRPIPSSHVIIDGQ